MFQSAPNEATLPQSPALAELQQIPGYPVAQTINLTQPPPVEAAASDKLSDVLASASPIVWALVVLVIALAYKTDIRIFLKRVREFELFGQTAKLDRDLDELQSAVEAEPERGEAGEGSHSVPKIVEPQNANSDDSSKEEAVPFPSPAVRAPSSVLDSVLSEAASSPKIGLISLASELERLVRGKLGNPSTPMPATRMLRTFPDVSPSLVQAFELFMKVRSRLVHGLDVSEDEVIRALDSGLRLYRGISNLQSLGRVIDAGQMFADDAGTEFEPPVRAVRVTFNDLSTWWPTDRIYRRGQTVRPEWDTTRSIKNAWVREDGRLRRSDWDSAAYFVGEVLGP